MKFSVEIELDWCGEDGLDDAVQCSIVNQIVEQLNEKIKEGLFSDAAKALSGRVDEFITEILNKFIEREVRVTDQWGDTQETYDSVDDMLKQRFDDFLTAPVDRSGKVVRKGCDYSDAYTRIKYLIDERTRKHSEKFMKDVEKLVDAAVKKTLTEKAKKTAADNILDALASARR